MPDTTSDDRYDLNRFVTAQADDYVQALAEIRSGRKHTHWMWYIFPQLDGLGSSPTAQFSALKSRAEAEAYLGHPVLGPRLVECAEAALLIQGRSALQVFGTPDDLKLRSSATLFAAVSSPGSVFHKLLAHYFKGEPDARTLALLGSRGGARRVSEGEASTLAHASGSQAQITAPPSGAGRAARGAARPG